MFEINVYGVIAPEGTGIFSLNELKDSLLKAEGKDIVVNINSLGGDVNEGLAIYSRLRKYAKENDATITTITEGHCASIATIVFLSGDVRKLNQYIEPFVHNAWTMGVGDGKAFQQTADNLEQTNDKLAKFYAEHTELSYDEARALMDNNTFITPEEALNIRFCTELDEIIRPAALQRFNQDNNEMSDTKAQFTTEHESILNKFMNFLGGKTAMQNLMVYTAANDEVVFPNAEDEGDISIGLSATINGQSASGSHLMKSGDTFVFEEGKLSEIIEKEDETITDLKAELEAKDLEIANFKNSLTEKETKLNEALELMKSHETILNSLKNASIETSPIENETPPTINDDKGGFSQSIKNLKL